MKFPNRQRRALLFLFDILLLLISGCAPTTEVPEHSTLAIPPSVTVPIISPSPIPTVEIVSTSTNQSFIKLSLEKDCIPIEEVLTKDLHLSGAFVWNFSPQLEVLGSHTKYRIPYEGGENSISTSDGNMAISPDHLHLAYIDRILDSSDKEEKRILRIIDSSGKAIRPNTWVENWQFIINWINNQDLAIFTGKQEVVILNPFTGKYNNFIQPVWMGKYGIYDFPHYSPTLKWLIDESFGRLKVRDVKTGTLIWDNDENARLAWSQTDSSLVIITKKDISFITDNQDINIYDARSLRVKSPEIAALSPDGKKLAFTSDNNNFYLMDINNLVTRLLCENKIYLRDEKPIWSPDNRFVLLNAYEPIGTYFDILIDTQQLTAYKLQAGFNKNRIAWLATP